MSIASKPLKKIEKGAQLRNWLDSIRVANPKKKLLCKDVVDAARDPKSPGHSEFTWDNSEAARKYRLLQAGSLIRRVYVLDVSNGHKTPAFVSLLPDREEPGGGYRATSEVLSSEALRAQLELTAKAELRGWTERYKMLTDLVNSVAAAAGIGAGVRKRAKK